MRFHHSLTIQAHSCPGLNLARSSNAWNADADAMLRGRKSPDYLCAVFRTLQIFLARVLVFVRQIAL